MSQDPGFGGIYVPHGIQGSKGPGMGSGVGWPGSGGIQGSGSGYPRIGIWGRSRDPSNLRAGTVVWGSGIWVLGPGDPGIRGSGSVSRDWDLGPKTGIWVSGDQDFGIRGVYGRDWRALDASGEARGRPEARTLRTSRAVCSILGGQGAESTRS